MNLERKSEGKWEISGTAFEIEALQSLLKAAKTDGFSLTMADVSDTEVVGSIETGSNREFSGDTIDDKFLDRY